MLFGGFGGQTASVYFDFGSNTMYATKGNTSGNCSTSYPRRYINTAVGACNNTSAFGRGVYAITILKSPMGDVRNKLFSNNPNSPYYNPSSPFADDTITFNHSHHNSVNTHTLSVNRSMRAAFGYLSSTEQNWLDGRNPSDIAINSWVNMVQPEEWSGTYPALADVKFNKFVPGSTLNPATGRNFGAGMSGGIAYVYDEDGSFAKRCNTSMVSLDKVLTKTEQETSLDRSIWHRGECDEVQLRKLIEDHHKWTGSLRARHILDHWADSRAKFLKVFPNEYKRALGELNAAKEAGDTIAKAKSSDKKSKTVPAK